MLTRRRKRCFICVEVYYSTEDAIHKDSFFLVRNYEGNQRKLISLKELNDWFKKEYDPNLLYEGEEYLYIHNKLWSGIWNIYTKLKYKVSDIHINPYWVEVE